MSISLTVAAADRVRTFLNRRGHGLGLRLGVKKTGCSGFAYVVNYADDLGKQDIVVEDDGSGCLRLLPHRHGTDGFFAAVLQRA